MARMMMERGLRAVSKNVAKFTSETKSEQVELLMLRVLASLRVRVKLRFKSAA